MIGWSACPDDPSTSSARRRVGDLAKDRRHDQLDIRLPQMRVAGSEFGDEI
jgi:hypothetical protein